jgi:hypothetical protein
MLSSPDEPDGEVTFGEATLVDLDSRSRWRVKNLGIPVSQDDATAPVWSPDGRSAYIMTTEGLYQCDVQSAVAKPLIKGQLAGLAISSDGTRLAFWNLNPSQKGHYELVVFDLKTGRVVRTWNLRTQYGADQYGFEISFGQDANMIYARTYDTVGKTPLKQFRVTTGKVLVIAEDCASLAGTQDSVLFVASKGETLSLLKTDDTTKTQVLRRFVFDSLWSTGTRRWVVTKATRSGKLGIFDSQSNRLVELGDSCFLVTVLATGEFLFAKEGRLLKDAADCK